MPERGPRGAYGLPKAKPTPKRKPRSTGTNGPKSEAAAGGGYGVKKAAKFKRTAPYRGAVRAAYDAQPVPQRAAVQRVIEAHSGLASAKSPRQVRRAVRSLSPEERNLLHTHVSRMARNDALRSGRVSFNELSDFQRRRVADLRSHRGAPSQAALADALSRVTAGVRNSTDPAYLRGYDQAHAGFTGMSGDDRRRADAMTGTRAFKDTLDDIRAGRPLGSATSKRVYGQEYQQARAHQDPLGAMGASARATDAKAKPRKDLVAGVDHTALQRSQARIGRELATAGVSGNDIRDAINKLGHDHEELSSKVLRQFTRVSSAEAGAVHAGLHGKNPVKGLVHGAIKNDQSFASVVKDLGGGKTLQRVGGLIGDVALDPTTYLTLGLDSPALAAAKEAKYATLALTKGDEAAALGEARRVFDSMGDHQARGIRVGLRGTPVRLGSMSRQFRTARATGHADFDGAVAARDTAHDDAAALRATKNGKPHAERVAIEDQAKALDHKAADAEKIVQEGPRVSRLRNTYRASTREIRSNGKLTSRYVGRPTAATGRVFFPHGSPRAARLEAASKELLHNHMPLGMHPVDFDHIKHSTRELRAMRGNAERYALRRGEKYRKVLAEHGIGPEEQHQMVLAIDDGTWRSSLQGPARDVAQAIVKDLRRIGDVEIAHGMRAPTEMLHHYFPRMFREDVDGTINGVKTQRAGGMSRKIGGDEYHHRTQGPLRSLPQVDLAEYLTDDIATVMARRHGNHYRNRGLKQFHDRLGALGEPLKLDTSNFNRIMRSPGRYWDRLYVREGRGWKPIVGQHDSSEAAARKIEQAIKPDYTWGNPGHEIRVIPDHVMEHAWERAARGQGSAEITPGGRFFDRIQGTIKTGQTVINPGYHITNAIGDLWNARLGGARFADLKGAVRQERVARDTTKLAEDLTHPAASHIDTHNVGPRRSKLTRRMVAGADRAEHYGKNGMMTDAEVAHLARQYGAIDMGFAGNELRALRQHELPSAAGGPLRQGGRRFMDGIRNANEARENAVRLVSFRSALKRGMNPRDAAEHVNRFHFDYGDLTRFERAGARRAIPFYTFASRNAPLQMRSLLTSPGRYATMQKTQDQLSEATGLDPHWVAGLQKYVQNQHPFAIPVTLPGSDGLPMAVNLKLPLNDLSLIDPRNWPDEFTQRMTVLARVAYEQKEGYNSFFHQRYQGANKLVPAPSWAMIPVIKHAVESLGGVVKTGPDRASGKVVPLWSWRIDQLARILPLGGMLLNASTPGKSLHSKGFYGASGTAIGPRLFPIDATQGRLSALFDKRDQLIDTRDQLKRTVIGHQPGAKWGGHIRQLNKQISATEDEITKTTSDYADPLFAKAKPKGHKHKIGSGNFGIGKAGGFGTGKFKP